MLWEHIYGEFIHQRAFQCFSMCFSVTLVMLNAPPNSHFSLQWILSIQKFYLLSFLSYLTCNLSFYELNQYYHLQINKNGFFGFMQTVHGMQYCLSIENIHCLLPCYFCSLHLVQIQNKDPAVKCFGTAFCTCAFAQCTVLDYLSMNPWSLPPRRNISSYLLLNWLDPFFVCV